MIEVELTNKLISKAKASADTLGALNMSFTSGQQNIYGFIGEEMVASKYPEFKRVNSYDYDFEFNGKKIDVKTNMIIVPNPTFLKGVEIFKYTDFQEYDWAIFCRVTKDLSRGFIMGRLKKDEFLEKAIVVKRGDTNPNGYKVKQDCYWLSIDELKKCP